MDKYGTNQVISLMEEIMNHHGFYDPVSLEYIKLSTRNVQIIATYTCTTTTDKKYQKNEAIECEIMLASLNQKISSDRFIKRLKIIYIDKLEVETITNHILNKDYNIINNCLKGT